MFKELDAHILATPVLRDLNNDGREEELVVPLSYYKTQRYELTKILLRIIYSGMSVNYNFNIFFSRDIKGYNEVTVGKIAILNITSLAVIWEKQIQLQVCFCKMASCGLRHLGTFHWFSRLFFSLLLL